MDPIQDLMKKTWIVAVEDDVVTLSVDGDVKTCALAQLLAAARQEDPICAFYQHVCRLVRDYERDHQWYAVVTFGDPGAAGKHVGFGARGRDACIRAAEAMKGQKSCSEARVVACESKDEALMADISGPHAVVWCA
jgi:hypothetical protein